MSPLSNRTVREFRKFLGKEFFFINSNDELKDAFFEKLSEIIMDTNSIINLPLKEKKFKGLKILTKQLNKAHKILQKLPNYSDREYMERIKNIIEDAKNYLKNPNKNRKQNNIIKNIFSKLSQKIKNFFHSSHTPNY